MLAPADDTAAETPKAPPCGAFVQCAEEDSNLHPVIPDQALNLVSGSVLLSTSDFRANERLAPETDATD